MNKKWKIIIIVLGIVIITWPEFTWWVQPTPRLVALDVGQGDALLLQDATHASLLIDGGSDSVAAHRLSRYVPVFARSLDVIIATHPDSDHIAGLVDVARRFPPEYFFETQLRNPSINLAAIRSNWSTQLPPRSFVLGDMTLTTLYPREDFTGTRVDDTNDTSIVLLVQLNGVSMLFMGDASTDVENDIITAYPTLDVDILKAGHHGSKTSTSEAFLDHVTPEIVIISVGKDNRYGHPHDVIMQRLRQRNITIMDTRNGDVVCIVKRPVVCSNP